LDPTEARRLSNLELVDRLVQANATDSVWSEFVVRFQGRIRLAVLRALRTEASRNPGLDTGSLEDSVSDLTQEVFVKLLEFERRALSRFRGRSEHSIYTYLATIAVNLVRDHFKKLRALKTPRATASISEAVKLEQESEGLHYDQALSSEGAGPERYVASQELRERMAGVVADASPAGRFAARDRLVFRLYFLEGLTVGEVARIPAVGLSPSGVEKCVRRIREALQQNLSVS
jgi:RNA polymerase sigma factor (sigma-70 family)